MKVDAAAPLDPGSLSWKADPTPERDPSFGGTGEDINEEYLASVAKWVGAREPQSGASTYPQTVGAKDRNAELLVGDARLLSQGLARSPRQGSRRELPVTGWSAAGAGLALSLLGLLLTSALRSRARRPKAV